MKLFLLIWASVITACLCVAFNPSSVDADDTAVSWLSDLYVYFEVNELDSDCWIDSEEGNYWSCEVWGELDDCECLVVFKCGCRYTYKCSCDYGGMEVFVGRTDGQKELFILGYEDVETKECFEHDDLQVEVFTGVTLLPSGTTLPNDITVGPDDAWRSFEDAHYTMTKGGDCWYLDVGVWECRPSGGECWVRFTHDWTGATHTFYADCKENDPMRLWFSPSNEWRVADWDKMVFKLKDKGSVTPTAEREY